MAIKSLRENPKNKLRHPDRRAILHFVNPTGALRRVQVGNTRLTGLKRACSIRYGTRNNQNALFPAPLSRMPRKV